MAEEAAVRRRQRHKQHKRVPAEWRFGPGRTASPGESAAGDRRAAPAESRRRGRRHTGRRRSPPGLFAAPAPGGAAGKKRPRSSSPPPAPPTGRTSPRTSSPAAAASRTERRRSAARLPPSGTRLPPSGTRIPRRTSPVRPTAKARRSPPPGRPHTARSRRYSPSCRTVSSPHFRPAHRRVSRCSIFAPPRPPGRKTAADAKRIRRRFFLLFRAKSPAAGAWSILCAGRGNHVTPRCNCPAPSA